MTKEQLAKGRDLQDAILAAKENVNRLTTKDFKNRRSAVVFEINLYDDYRNRITTLESDGAEPEILEKIKQVLLDYYTKKPNDLKKNLRTFN